MIALGCNLEQTACIGPESQFTPSPQQKNINFIVQTKTRKKKRILLPSWMRGRKRPFSNIIQIKPMKQIQNTVPQNTASRKSHYSAPTRRPNPASGAQIQGQIPPSKQNTKQREARKPPQRQGAQKSARRLEATQESIPYLTLRARTEHRVVSSPPHVVAACPASLCSRRQPARTGGEGSEPHRHRHRRRRPRRRVWDGKEEGGQRRAFRILPASRSVTFYNHGRPPQHSTASSSPRVASRAPPPPWPCLPVCLPLAASPLFLPAF